MGYEFELNGEVHRVEPAHLPGGLELLIEGQRIRASLRPGRQPGQQLLELDGREETIWIATRGDVHFVHLRGRTHRVHAINALTRARQAAEPSGGSELLRAPMPGVVVEVVVLAGTQVAPGQLLMTIESMKLQTPIRAPHAARVEEVCVAVGASFDEGAALVRLAAADDAEASTGGDTE